jgi:UDP-3-O-[3-hydroxymyristoyl] glucosamine N-acyltransferase
MATVGSLAALVGGTVIGDASHRIRDVADLDTAGPEDISFLANPKYRDRFNLTRAGAVVVPEGISEGPSASLIVCTNPYLALARIIRELRPPTVYPPGVESGAHVHPEARVDSSATIRVGAIVESGAVIGSRSVIGPGCYVGSGAQIGCEVLLHPGVKILERCVIHDRTIIQAGAVIGSDGFGFAPDDSSRRHKIPQVGIVEVGEDVEIGANTTIDRATFGVTRIGAGSKIDNLVQIAHNVITGKDCVIVAQSGIAGSTRIGERVIMGAQAGLVGHIELCDDVVLAARAGVPNNIREPGVYSGLPAMPHRLWLKVAMAQQILPQMRRRLRHIEKRIDELESNKG